VVLGREVTLKEIKEIHQAMPKIELEYFIHGAMCMAYSGRCFLSKMMLDRSGNLGDCAQPCRFEYNFKEFNISARGHDEELELVEERHGSYILNSKDLCLLKYLRQLREAGIVSFKIEGRAKSVYYQAIVCGVYRRALSALQGRFSAFKLKNELDYLYQELETKLVHRGYTTGFLLGGKADQNIEDSHNKSSWEFCGQVLKVEKDKELSSKTKIKKIFFKVHNTIKAGEEIEIIGRNYDIIKIRLKLLYDAKTGAEMIEAHGGGGSQIAFFKLSEGELNGAEIFPLAVLCRLKK